MSTNAPRLTGTVQFYNSKRGFGFVTPDAGGDDVFIHRSALKKSRLKKGDRITFLVETHNKKPTARAITLLNGRGSGNGRASDADTRDDAAPTGGPATPDFAAGFNDLGLNADLLRAVAAESYETPTPIQSLAIPPVLVGRDVLGCAQTGTGKTAAFALPILHNLAAQGSHSREKKRPIRVLVLSPTRELAIQIGASFDAYGRYTDLTNTVIFGGVGQNPQVQALQRGVDVLVATPGRLLDLIGQGYIKLDRVEVLVLDEADRMLDMGFIHDVRRIIKHVPNQRQTLLFSATMPREIVDLAANILHEPVEITVAPEKPTVEAIDQAVYFVEKKQKLDLLKHLLQDKTLTRVLVFSRTKHGANKIVKKLVKSGVQAEPIHGNKSQTARQRALQNFMSGKTRVLVATDVVARGIDVEDISHVIQFDLSNEPETYVHRIGRTGRAGAEGIALAFCATDERPYLKDIEKLIRMRVPVVKDHPMRG